MKYINFKFKVKVKTSGCVLLCVGNFRKSPYDWWAFPFKNLFPWNTLEYFTRAQLTCNNNEIFHLSFFFFWYFFDVFFSNFFLFWFFFWVVAFFIFYKTSYLLFEYKYNDFLNEIKWSVNNILAIFITMSLLWRLLLSLFTEFRVKLIIFTASIAFSKALSDYKVITDRWLLSTEHFYDSEIRGNLFSLSGESIGIFFFISVCV